MDAQQELQKVMYQADIYRKHIEEINEQVSMIDMTIKTMEATIEALNLLNKTEIDTEILVPLGSNCFARAKLSDNKDVILGIGAGISVEKTIPESVKSLDESIENLNGATAEMQKKSAEIENLIAQLDKAGEQIIRAAQEQGQV